MDRPQPSMSIRERFSMNFNAQITIKDLTKNKVERMFTTSRGTVVKIVVYEK